MRVFLLLNAPHIFGLSTLPLGDYDFFPVAPFLFCLLPIYTLKPSLLIFLNFTGNFGTLVFLVSAFP
jgi:hypothetical protein